jgi:hypothetical protein
MRHLAVVLILAIYSACSVSAEAQAQTAKGIETRGFHSLSALGGQLIGVDGGEWGGELLFKDQRGTTKRLLNENVRGIVRMPSGTVIILTGLAHKRVNRGAVYTVLGASNEDMRLQLVHDLQGAPRDLVQQSDGALAFRVFTGQFIGEGREATAVYACRILDTTLVLRTVECGEPAGTGAPAQQ